MKIQSLICFFALLASVSLKAENSSLKTCPESPNCVSSLTESKEHHLKAIAFSGTKTEAFTKLKDLVLGLDRTRLESETEDQLHFVFTSFLFRFKDDVWFAFDEDKQQIHFKSQSRVGYSDLGANKNRIEKIRALLNQ